MVSVMNRATTKILIVGAIVSWFAVRLLWWDAVWLGVLTTILLYALVLLLVLIERPFELWHYRGVEAVCLAGLSLSFGGIVSAVILCARNETALSKKLMPLFSLAWVAFFVLAWLYEWRQSKQRGAQEAEGTTPKTSLAIFMPMPVFARVGLLCIPTLAAQLMVHVCSLLF